MTNKKSRIVVSPSFAHNDRIVIGFLNLDQSSGNNNYMNHSSDNSEPQSSVFNSTQEMMKADLKLLNQRVKTARVILLTLGAILLLSIVLSMFANRLPGSHVSELLLPGITLLIIFCA